MLNIDVSGITGFTKQEMTMFQKCLDTYNNHWSANKIKEKYYEGNIPLSEVNLGIALPKKIAGLEIGCPWGTKAVDVLAARSRLDGFVSANGTDNTELDQIMDANRFVAAYSKACRDELKFGCSFAALSGDDDIRCRIRFYSPRNAAAIWDGEKGRIACGFVIVSCDQFDPEKRPDLINFYTDDSVWVLTRKNEKWSAVRYPHRMGRPLMEPLIWNATSNKPFGRSRIKGPIRRLIQGYVRTIANATIGLEFSTAPQKYLLGVTDDQYDAIVSDKFKQYVGSIITATPNPETGEKPTFGQLAQGTISPHVEMMRVLATQFSAATGLPVTDTGVVNDANPTSSDAIEAQTKTLVGLAEDLNESNGDSLKIIARMALAIANDKALDDLTQEEMAIMPHFKNPAMPSIAATTDAALKLATVRDGFSSTDVFLEMVGFDQSDIRRIKAQEQRARGQQLLAEEFMNADNDEGLE